MANVTPIMPVLMPERAVTLTAHPSPAVVAAKSAMTVMPARLWVPVLRPQPASLPLAGTQIGSLFQDRANGALRWFVPGFVLADDPDPCFGFAASQAGTDGGGRPFNKLRLTFGLRKVVPADVTAFKAANPAIEVREVPLQGLVARLSIAYKDASSGADLHSDFPGSVEPHGPDLLQVVLDNVVIGDKVIVLYDDLVRFGGAQVSLAASYDAWFSQPPAHPPVVARPFQMMAAPAPAGQVMASRPSLMMARTAIYPQHLPPASPGTPAAAPQFVQGTLSFAAAIAIDRKYATHAYQLKYTVDFGGVARTIVDDGDLTSFNVKQSEFVELVALGNVNAKYPSLARLYLGTLSRTIVVVPTRYAVIRGTTSCAAACTALLDSSPTDASACKFQFGFLLAPHVSPIELAQLAQEIAVHPEIKDCTLRFPEALADSHPSLLNTPFVTSTEFSRGSEPHNFSLSVEIRDDSSGTPATANANLFIKQLCVAAEPYLSGSLYLKLDDAYPAPIAAGIVLNFKQTSSAGKAGDPAASGFACSIDETAQTVAIANATSFDLQLSRYGFATARGIVVLSAGITLAGGQTMSVPLPADHDGLAVLTECELGLPAGDLPKDRIVKYMQFQSQDVQNVRYSIGINASTVDFGGLGATKIDVRVSLLDLPQVSIPVMSLNKLLTLTSTALLLPIQYGIGSLKSTIQFHLEFADTAKPAIDFTRSNDFNDKPIYVLSGSDIPAPGAAPS